MRVSGLFRRLYSGSKAFVDEDEGGEPREFDDEGVQGQEVDDEERGVGEPHGREPGFYGFLDGLEERARNSSNLSFILGSCKGVIT